MDAPIPPDARRCDASLAQAFAVLGKRWNGMILGVLGDGGASFSGLRRALDGISDSMLSERLSELAANGLVTRTVDAGPPGGVHYDLTAGGEALVPALEQIRDWASVHLPGPA